MQPNPLQTQPPTHPSTTPRTTFRIVSVILTAVAVAAILVPATHRVRAEVPTERAVESFRIGWYDYLGGTANLSTIRQEGMDTVMPYHENADVVAYLNRARESGVQVFLEIDRAVVRTGDSVAVAAWVAKYKAHPAISGWYLADEPSTNPTLGPMNAATLERLYRAVKAEDPARPVTVAFATSDDMPSFGNAYDIAMWDEYPCKRLQAEYAGMDVWRHHLEQRAAAAASKQGWIPIVQAFAMNNWRLPTAGEERYMTYTAVQSGATGIFYWARYRSQPSWIANVLKPLTAEVRRLAPALAKGRVANAATVRQGANVVSTTYRDPNTGKYVLIVVNHSAGRVDAKLSISSALGVTTARTGNVTTRIEQGTLGAALQRYEARVYDLS
jgi:hypothetical protein